MRILVTQQNVNIISKIKNSLSADGFDTDTTSDGEMAFWYANEGEYDLIILDTSLREANGYNLCVNIRSIDRNTPILMITMNNPSPLDEIKALDCGADDFLRAPVPSPLLLARIRALLRRRHQETSNATISFGKICFSLKSRELFFDGQEMLLSNREYQIMSILVQAQGEVVNKQKLIDLVWGIEFDGNPTILDVYIGYLRRKLEGYCISKSLLQTVRGVGYRLVLEYDIDHS